MKITNFMKVFFYVSILSILLFLYISFRDLKNSNNAYFGNKLFAIQKTARNFLNEINIRPNIKQNNKKELSPKYILQWTSPKNIPFVYMGVGQQGFIERKCAYTNCFVTANKTLLGDYTKFDVIVFAGPEVVHMNPSFLPATRSPHQKFTFASIESGDNYPVCTHQLDSFFNWTWTYRLDSDAKWGYIVIKDSENNIIGPKKDMNWIDQEDMEPINDEFKEKLKKKTKPVAWFVSNCYSRSGREKLAKDLDTELVKYNLKIDVYGRCGSLSCSRDNEEKCDAMIERDYFFYLSFENSFAEDYVTEKLLHPLKHLTVPIVYGGANYTRFMPDGIYLNAMELSAKKLAEKIHALIMDPDEYAEYFRWRNHYSYHSRSESVETDDYCRFCSILNEEDTVKKVTVYNNFRQWWDPPSRC